MRFRGAIFPTALAGCDSKVIETTKNTTKKFSLLKLLSFVFGISVTAFFGYMIFVRIDLQAVQTAFSNVNPGYILAGLLVLTLGYATRIARWWLMLRCLSHRLAYRRCVAPMMISIAMNSLLPFRAGDMARVVAFKSLKVNASLLLSTLIVERLLDLTVLLGLFFIALQWVPSSGIPSELTEGATWLTVIALIAVCGVLLMPGVARRVIRWTGSRLPWADKLLNKIDQFLQGIEVLCKFRDAVKLVALTGLMWLLEAGVFVMVGRSLGLLDQASGTFFSMTTGTLSTLIPSSPGYIGTFHYFSMQGLMAFGTGADAAAAFAIIVHLLLWLPPTLVGLIFLSLIWK